MELALAGGVALTGDLPPQLLLLCANCGLWNGVGSSLVATHQHLNRRPTTNPSQVSIQMSGPIHTHLYLQQGLVLELFFTLSHPPHLAM